MLLNWPNVEHIECRQRKQKAVYKIYTKQHNILLLYLKNTRKVMKKIYFYILFYNSFIETFLEKHFKLNT